MNQNLLHKSPEGVLDRERAIAEARELIDYWSLYFEDLINFASNALARCQLSLRGVQGTPSSLIYIYYHIIQMADGIHSACSKACFAAAYPALRSVWEGVISMEFMLDSDFEDRSSAWLACGHLESMEYWELQDKTSKRGKQVEDMRRSDKYFSQVELGEQDPTVIREQIQAYEKLLAKPKFAAVMSKLTGHAKKKKKWYSVNGGANSLWQMAEKLNRTQEYVYLYSKYSAIAHSKDSSRMLAAVEGIPCFEPIRSSSAGVEVYSLTCGYLMEATDMIVRKLRPNEDIAEQLTQIIRRHRPDAIRR